MYNMQQPVGQRVVSVEARCLKCDVPSYSPLIDTEEYKIFLSTFLINGGDGYNFEPLRRLRFSKFIKYSDHRVNIGQLALSFLASETSRTTLFPNCDLPQYINKALN